VLCVTRSRPRNSAIVVVLAVVLLAVLAYLVAGRGAPVPVPAPTAGTSQSVNTDAQLAQLFQTQTSNVQVRGQGIVTKLLADDNNGDRHQRFILQLASGQTLLIAHNIDVAPRLNGLAVGDRVAFYGEYVYSDQGGTIHWTHHDPGGTHVAGWLEWNGKRYS